MGIRIFDDLTYDPSDRQRVHFFLALTTRLRSRVHCSNQPTKSDRPAYRTGLLSAGLTGAIFHRNDSIVTQIMDMQMFQLMIVTALGLTAFSLPADANVMIIIDKGAQSMSVIVDGDKRWVWLVSTGREGYATPEGSYKALKMEETHTSEERNEPPIPHAIFFTKQGHAIHGTYEVRRLGTPASHGLVRLSTRNAATLFAVVKQHGLANTEIVVIGVEDFRTAAKPRQRSLEESKPVPRPVPFFTR